MSTLFGVITLGFDSKVNATTFCCVVVSHTSYALCCVVVSHTSDALCCGGNSALLGVGLSVVAIVEFHYLWLGKSLSCHCVTVFELSCSYFVCCPIASCSICGVCNLS